MALRIFEIAKELGVDSKAIVAKCHAEGIPEATVKNHMSTVSVGLAASIRDWFASGAEGVHTAVETAEKVDVEKVKKTTTRKKTAKKDGEDEGAATAVAEPVAPAPAPVVVHATPHLAPPLTPAQLASNAAAVGGKAMPIASTMPATPAKPVAPAVAQPKPAAAAAAAPAPAPTKVAPTAPQPTPAPATPAAAEAIKPQPASSISMTPQARSSISSTPPPRSEYSMRHVRSREASEAARPNVGPTSVPMPGADQRPDSSRDGGGSAGSGQAATTSSAPTRPQGPLGPHAVQRPPVGPVRTGPAPMNVPVRPTGVVVAGPKLESRAPVRLSGPKVVRVEAPENVEAPRPRRVGPGGPSSGPRPGMGGGSATDDRSRSPRRGPAGATPMGSKDARRPSAVPERRRGIAGSTEEWDKQIVSEQDIIEREERLARAGGFLKKRKQGLSKPGQAGAMEQAEGRIRVVAPFTLKDLSAATGVKAADISKKLFMEGIMLKINDPMPVEKAIEVMMEFDIDLDVTEARTAEEQVSDVFLKREAKDMRARGPVVTILGHVDHGKTSLLDKIRNASVAAGEAGGITQKTSAFVSEITIDGEKKQVVFLDTPGHEAFTGMRARGAKLTDVVVLVVSAPEGVMPQTIESINHARAAKVPIVVAMNKIDRPDATEGQIQKTLGELAAAGLNPVEWGGDTEVIRVSAVSGEGIPKLLETLDLQSSILELKADFDGAAQGTVIEAKTEEGRGAVANILIQQGKLRVGDFVVMGRAFGRVRDITDDKGKRIREATAPMPVQVSGMDVVCDAGDKFYVTTSLKAAEEAAEQRRSRERHLQLAQPKVTLDSLFGQMSEGDVKEIKIVLKTDQQGTVDVLKAECEKIKTSEVRVRVLHSAVGGITESDVILADASKAIIIGFNAVPSGKARTLADQKGVEIRTYQVIYDITDDLKKAAEGLLAPDVREEILGHAEVRKVFTVSKVGTIAGCYVTDGTVQRDALIRVTRNGLVIQHDRKLSQLKRVKDDAKEVRSGMECGMKIDAYDDVKEGDILECYKKIEVKRSL